MDIGINFFSALMSACEILLIGILRVTASFLRMADLIPYFASWANAVAVADGDKIISIDLDMKVANKATLPVKPVNYLNLTDEVRELHKIKET